MSRDIYPFIRSVLFYLDAEDIHHLTLQAVRLAGRFPPAAGLLRRLFDYDDPRLAVTVFGRRFRNPVGLAAGYDKNGQAVDGLGCLGFGHVEVGTFTPRAQPGNPRPRIHRLPEVQALVNSMGFPNGGLAALRLPPVDTARARRTLIGVNVGKNKDTPLERAVEDYVALVKAVHGRADYVALNVSSPNTPGLRQLQARSALEELLGAVTAVRDSLTPRVPVLVKIAPDLSEAEIDDVLAAITASGVDGIIATNTTLSRAGAPPRASQLAGGLSGAPLRARATAIIRYIARRTEGRLPIIGVGGIAGPADALEKMRAGACLVQVYTGLIYAGPALARRINLGLLEECERQKLRQVSELVGSG